ncbi:MAG: hypothetical protein IT367_20320 [Candidatus Hydrogenedentes bacterium]|nr:hypothetical protein [Candidatus Hydrogenedentota bacterium]
MGKGNAATQIALGLATGALQGFAHAKKEKKEETREDERFALYKQMHELQIANAQTQGKLLDLEYDHAKRSGAVFTPEQEAEYKKNRMMLDARAAEAEAKLKEFDVSTQEEDRALNNQYKRAQIGAMERSGRGGGGGGGGARSGSGDGGDDGLGLDINAQRVLQAAENRMSVYRNAHFNEDSGEWDSEDSLKKYQLMANDFEALFTKLTGFEGSKPEVAPNAPATEGNPDAAKSSADADAPKASKNGAWRTPLDWLGEKFGGGKLGFNLEKAIDQGVKLDDPAIQKMVRTHMIGREVIEGPDGKAKILDTGEAIPMADPTDPLGLGIFAGLAGAGRYAVRKGIGKGLEEAIPKPRWEPNLTAPEFPHLETPSVTPSNVWGGRGSGGVVSSPNAPAASPYSNLFGGRSQTPGVTPPAPAIEPTNIWGGRGSGGAIAPAAPTSPGFSNVFGGRTPTPGVTPPAPAIEPTNIWGGRGSGGVVSSPPAASPYSNVYGGRTQLTEEQIAMLLQDMFAGAR